jgi:hypothetical protein
MASGKPGAVHSFKIDVDSRLCVAAAVTKNVPSL